MQQVSTSLLCQLLKRTHSRHAFKQSSWKPCKTLFINTPLIRKMYKGSRKKREEFKGHQVSTQTKWTKSLNLNNQPLYLISQLPTILLFARMEKKPMMFYYNILSANNGLKLTPQNYLRPSLEQSNW
jgi:hypothetical protein